MRRGEPAYTVHTRKLQNDACEELKGQSYRRLQKRFGGQKATLREGRHGCHPTRPSLVLEILARFWTNAPKEQTGQMLKLSISLKIWTSYNLLKKVSLLSLSICPLCSFLSKSVRLGSSRTWLDASFRRKRNSVIFARLFIIFALILLLRSEKIIWRKNWFGESDQKSLFTRWTSMALVYSTTGRPYSIQPEPYTH